MSDHKEQQLPLNKLFLKGAYDVIGLLDIINSILQNAEAHSIAVILDEDEIDFDEEDEKHPTVVEVDEDEDKTDSLDVLREKRKHLDELITKIEEETKSTESKNSLKNAQSSSSCLAFPR